MNIKFSAIIVPEFHPRPDMKAVLQIAENTFVGFGKFSDFINEEPNKHWKTWFGSLLWESTIEKNSFFIVRFAEAKTPGVLDGENVGLDSNISPYFNALTLSAPWIPPDTQGVQMSGDGTFLDSKFRVEQIRSHSKLDYWFRSQYSREKSLFEYVGKVCRDFSAVERIVPIRDRIDNLVGNVKSQLLVAGLIAYDHSLKTSRFDFKVPNLTRAIESVVALSIGQGKLFPNRAQKFLTDAEIAAAGLDRTGAEDVLGNCYEIRNACMHGMWFDHKIKSKLQDNTEYKLRVHEFILESCARNCLNWALKEENFLKVSRDRDALEQAWKNGTFDQIQI